MESILTFASGYLPGFARSYPHMVALGSASLFLFEGALMSLCIFGGATKPRPGLAKAEA